MTTKDIIAIIYEAIYIYIDDVSMINDVKNFQDESHDASGLEITLINGDVYRLTIIPTLISLK